MHPSFTAAIRLAARRFVRMLRMPPRELATMLHALAIIIVVEMLIRWVPLPRLSRMLGVRLNLEPVTADVEQMPWEALPPKARRQLCCTHQLADVWPFSRGPCLRRTLVAGHLLRHENPAVRLGLIGAGDDLTAHAWLEIDERPLEDVAEFDAFQRESTEATG